MYPLVKQHNYGKIHHFLAGYIQYKPPFSIAMLNYQRVPTTKYLLFTRYSRLPGFAPWVSITLLIWISQVDQEWVSYGLINPSKLEDYYWDVYGFMGLIMICFATLTQMAWSYTIWDNMNFHTVATPFRLAALDPQRAEWKHEVCHELPAATKDVPGMFQV